MGPLSRPNHRQLSYHLARRVSGRRVEPVYHAFIARSVTCMGRLVSRLEFFTISLFDLTATISSSQPNFRWPLRAAAAKLRGGGPILRRGGKTKSQVGLPPPRSVSCSLASR